jgi:hypothetical protein
MAKTAIDLGRLVHETFAHSRGLPTSMKPVIKGPRPFYYHIWCDRRGEEEGIDIVRFDGPVCVQTAKLFSYTMEQLYAGVDLTKDKPQFVGDGVVDVVERYAEIRTRLLEHAGTKAGR